MLETGAKGINELAVYTRDERDGASADTGYDICSTHREAAQERPSPATGKGQFDHSLDLSIGFSFTQHTQNKASAGQSGRARHWNVVLTKGLQS